VKRKIKAKSVNVGPLHNGEMQLEGGAGST
jgi:hypothetical protein